jgi:Zn-dependent protease with chaperone function
MNLLMALVRSAYLAFLVGYTLVVSPLGLFWSGSAIRQGNLVAVPIVEKIFTAAWLGIGWIAIEAVVAWARVWREARARRRAASAAPPPGPQPAP